MTQTISYIYNDKKIFLILLASVVFSWGAYLVLVNNTVLNVVHREKMAGNISVLQARLSEMESSYISQKNSISLDFAYSQGYKQVNDTQFIERAELGKGLSVNVLP